MSPYLTVIDSVTRKNHSILHLLGVPSGAQLHLTGQQRINCKTNDKHRTIFWQIQACLLKGKGAKLFRIFLFPVLDRLQVKPL